MTKIDLEFLENSGGEAEGLSDAGIETFRENPFVAVARETGQNSRDARNSNGEPVLMKFDVISIPTANFPSIEAYRVAARLCLEKSKDAVREKERTFFENAVSSLGADELKILRIADFNTKGVRGPCEEGQPFHTLAKTDGMSVKDDPSAGGSFGIGKNATFALSDIQTVFVSTLYRENGCGPDQVLCMGKTQFISFTDENGIERRRRGYWGKVENFMPLEEHRDIPEWLRRTDQGTSLFSISLRNTPTKWRYEVTAAILINFFCAIERREMEFEVDDGSIKIDSNTIQELFNDEQVGSAVDRLRMRFAFDTARRLHECLIDKHTISQIINIQDIGEVKLHLLLREGQKYTVGIIRNGMYITNNLSYFNEPFQRFPLYKEFAAVIEPNGVPESEWFRRLENPRHDSLSADRILDPKLREIGMRGFSELACKIRKEIKKLAKTQSESSIDLDELNEFFVMDGTRSENVPGSEPDPREKSPTEIQQRQSELKYRPYKRAKIPSDKPIPDPNPKPNPNPSPPSPPSPPPSPRPLREIRSVELINERALLPDLSTPKNRRLLFTSPINSEITIDTYASGLNSRERLPVINSSCGVVRNGAIEIYCDAEIRVVVDVEFESAYEGPVEISAYQSADGEGGSL